MTTPTGSPDSPKPSLQDEIANAAGLIAQQNAERKITPVKKDRSVLWFSLSLVALVVTVWFERGQFATPEIPPAEERAIQEATANDLRIAIEGYRDKAGRAPATLEEIGWGLLPASYVVTDSVFRLALPLASGDSVSVSGSARRATP